MRCRPGGFTLIGLLVVIVVLGLVLGAAGEVTSTAVRREKEAELLWVGHQYRAAIGRYWIRRRAYPRALDELVGGPAGAPLQVRDLRRLYPDPMTGAADWELLLSPRGGIMGVASTSRRAPVKTGGFDDVDAAFEGASAYSDWRFTFPPGAAHPKAP